MATTIDAAAIARQATAISSALPTARHAMARAVKERIIGLEAQLDRQYTWLGANPNHPDAGRHTETWIADLLHYQAACDALTDLPNTTQGRLIA